MYSMDEILAAQEAALEHFRNSPYYTADNVVMYQSVFGMMNVNLPKATGEDSLHRTKVQRINDEALKL